MIRRNTALTELTLGDQLVTVAVGSEAELRVVEMQEMEAVEANRIVEVPPDAIEIANEVVAGRKEWHVSTQTPIRG